MHVLVIEDDPDVRGAFQRMLQERVGATCRPARSLTEAFAIADEEGPPDVVMLGDCWPEMCAWDMLQDVANRLPGTPILRRLC